MVKKPEHSDEQLLEILSKAQNDRDYIERLEKTLKQAKKLIKRDKYTPLTCPRCNQTFLPHDKRQRFCTTKCTNADRMSRYRAEKHK